MAFSFLLFLVIVGFNAINDTAVITKLFVVAGYTYGPILGLFAFGMFTRLKVRDKFVPVVCILAPITAFVLDTYSAELFFGFKFGFLTIALNGLLTFFGLLAISYREYETKVGDDQLLEFGE